LHLSDMRVGDSLVSLDFHRMGPVTSCALVDQTGDLRVSIDGISTG
jgi:hypothetical protein